MTNPAETAGASGDGSKSLASESKFGLAVAFVLSVLASGALDALTNLDTSAWSGWWATVGVAGVSTAVGLLTAYLKRNKK